MRPVVAHLRTLLVPVDGDDVEAQRPLVEAVRGGEQPRGADEAAALAERHALVALAV
jgi:hypothetical protein